MKRGYYLWDWRKSGTITFDTFSEFVDEDYANGQDAFRRFADAKSRGLAELSFRIDELQQLKDALEKLEIKDVKK